MLNTWSLCLLQSNKWLAPMAPNIHPPCVPSASCTPLRCHPTPPPCARPEECLRQTIKKGVRPCRSAVSIMATRSKGSCTSCGRSNANNERVKQRKIKEWLRTKKMEDRMRKSDKLHGTHRYTRYMRRKGMMRRSTDCCAGHGHRGRVSNRPVRKCIIL